jgi:hypothetical protein
MLVLVGVFALAKEDRFVSTKDKTATVGNKKRGHCGDRRIEK